MKSADEFPFAAVLFDLDGVVIDTTALHYRVWAEFARSRHFVPSPAELLATNGRRASETIRLWLGPDISEFELLGLTAEREAAFNALLASEPVSAVAGVVQYVARLALARIKRAVVTSAMPANAGLSLRRVGMEDAFNVIVTATDVQHGKPEPECYLAAADALDVPASRCVVIEDSVSGLRAAKAAGMRCVAMTTTLPKELLAAERPDWLASDFHDLPPELRL
jgi:HAD superfamily hydrolase (TIGR01509 family)